MSDALNTCHPGSDTTSVGPRGAASAPFGIDRLHLLRGIRLNPLAWEQKTRLNEKIVMHK